MKKILWGVKNGSANWQEEIISVEESNFNNAIQWAKLNGYTNFRIANINMDVNPNFTKTINFK